MSKNPRIAALFPGQGSHAIGMGADLAKSFDIAAKVYEQADIILPNLRALIEQGPLEELTMTANQQPALVLASVAAYRAWQQKTGLLPVVAAGHSLGEYSALVAAEVLNLDDALRLTRRRGELMQEAVPPSQGAMSAVMGDPAVVAEICQQVSHETGLTLQPANFNAPTQTVISGDAIAVAEANKLLKDRKLRAIPLKVSAPFHCQLMQTAADGLAPLLKDVSYQNFSFPVVHNISAAANDNAQKVADLLVEQITGSVQWVKTIENISSLEIDLFIEFGVGNVLSGLVKRILPKVKVISIGNVEQVNDFSLEML